MYELKIYKGSMCHVSEGWCQNWNGVLAFLNWHGEFDEIWPEHSKV